MNENEEYLMQFSESSLQVFEAAFKWSKESEAIVNDSMDPMNLLMGFIIAKPEFTKDICDKAGINLKKFEKQAEEAAKKPSFLKNYTALQYASFYDWFRENGFEYIKYSLIFAFNFAIEKTEPKDRKTNYVDLMYGLSLSNHGGNRMGYVLTKSGWAVGEMGEGQSKWIEAVREYIANNS